MNDHRHHSGPTANDGNDRIRAALDAEARSVERRHGDRLEAARRAAMAEHDAHRTSRPVPFLALAASLAVAALASLVLLNGPDARTPMPETADLELLASDEYELLTEDLEFYAWLAAQDPAAEEQSG